jgi:hypothetical protein
MPGSLGVRTRFALCPGMTLRDITPRSRGALRPKLCKSFGPQEDERAQGRPGARCTRGLVCKCTSKSAHEHTGSAETLRPSLRNGSTAYGALSPEYRAFMPPSPSGIRRIGPVGLSAPPKDLTPTTEASGPHAFAVHCSAGRLRAADRSRENPPCHHVSRPTLPRPPHPAPPFVTMANAPLTGRDGDGYRFDLGQGEMEYF